MAGRSRSELRTKSPCRRQGGLVEPVFIVLRVPETFTWVYVYTRTG
jgi:hypothetical protein